MNLLIHYIRFVSYADFLNVQYDFIFFVKVFVFFVCEISARGLTENLRLHSPFCLRSHGAFLTFPSCDRSEMAEAISMRGSA